MRTRQAIRERQRKKKRQTQLVTLLIISGVALVVVALVILVNLRPIGEIIPITPRLHPMADGVALGDPDAPVVLEEYSDFQCSACRVWYETVEPNIIQNYVETGKVYFIYRNFAFLGPESTQAANASLCAADQGRFWDYHDLLFTNQTGENIGAFSNRRLIAFAETLDLDETAFNDCFDEKRFQNQITEDLSKGRQIGVSGTPSIALNGVLLPTNSEAYITQQIEVLLEAPSQ